MKTAFWTPLVLTLAMLGGWASLAADPAPLSAQSYGNSSDVRQKTDWKQVFNQLLYWNIGHFPRCDAFTPDVLRHNAMYYTPASFNTSYYNLRNAAEKMSDSDLYELRETLLGMTPATGKQLSTPTSPDMSFGIQSVVQQNGPMSPLATALMAGIESETPTPYNWKTNFFDTPEGKAVMKALKDVTVVVVPGFGSHTIPYYTYAEIVKDANKYYCRKETRVVTEKNAKPVYGPGMSPAAFYAAKSCKDASGAPKPFQFDVVHPMGRELGNTMGPDDQAADALANFVNSLPAQYANRKLIFLGYSKGTPVTHNMLLRPAYSKIRNRTLAIVTLAGVNQGAITAEDALRSMKTALEEAAVANGQPNPHLTLKQTVDAITGTNMPLSQLYAIRSNDPGVAAKQEAASNEAASLFALATSKNQIAGTTSGPELKTSLTSTLSQVDAQQAQVNQDLYGVLDMTNYNRIKWNLVNMNDDDPSTPAAAKSELSVLSLSVLTNQNDWVKPEQSLNPLWASGEVSQLDISRMSPDNHFLLWTSLGMFQNSPMGLADTQVAWVDTKPMALDVRPLTESLIPDEIATLLADVNKERAAKHLAPVKATYPVNGVETPFEDMPRKDLLAAISSSRSRINFVDLGELRGTHWDISFEQVYRFSSIPGAPNGTPVTATADQIQNDCAVNPDGYKGYEHVFPRKAMLASLFETLALYLGSGNQ